MLLKPAFPWLIRTIAIVGVITFSNGCSQQAEIDSELKPNTRSEIPSIPDNSSKLAMTTIIVTNSETFDRSEETVSLALVQLAESNSQQYHLLAIYEDSKEIASQIIDADRDGNNDTLIFNTQLSAKSSKTFNVKFLQAETTTEFPKRSHAEISVKQGESYISVNSKDQTATHKIGDGLYRYEGPGWESDKIAYRRYYDERNVNDIFGKTIPDIILPKVGQPESDYHKLAPWGMDILKVGDSLGIGGVGMLVDNKVHRIDNSDSSRVSINSDGILQSQLQIDHRQWNIAKRSFDIKSTLTINAGSRLTHNKIQINSLTQEPVNNIVTGIVKHAPAELIHSNQNDKPDPSEWAYIASFGKQSVVDNNLGMAIFYPTHSLVELSEDEHSYLVVVKPINGLVDYYFSGAWQQDTDGFSNKEDFISDLNRTLKQLNSSLQVVSKQKP